MIHHCTRLSNDYFLLRQRIFDKLWKKIIIGLNDAGFSENEYRVVDEVLNMLKIL